ncbi:MAG: DUF1624 domain-containing protein [Candidatus Lokiarchaeota archaeon]|nr:DUF1624 domain-containing protein [Candidatus Lokiarchaeota archaeon]
MKRIQSIDMIRGFCIFLMVLGHVLDWWILWHERWLINFLFSFLAPIAATGFLFISGFSAAIAYKSSVRKAAASPDATMSQARNTYILRALLLLVIAFLYNIAIAIGINDLRWIWAWNALQTISISLLLAWPLLRTSINLRLILGICLLIINELLFPILSPFEDQPNIYGVLFHFFYNPIEAFTILAYFAIFIIGSAFGDFFYNINSIQDQEERKNSIKTIFLRAIFVIGVIFTTFGMIYRFSDFLTRRTISSMFYSIGVVLILLAILIYLEEFEKINPKKRYRFFFYYSFYSFTIYILHDPLYFLFYQQLNQVIVWGAAIGLFVLLTLLLRILYKKVGSKASLKTQLGILSLIIAKRIEHRKRNN